MAGDWASHLKERTRVEFFAIEFIIGDGYFMRSTINRGLENAFSMGHYRSDTSKLLNPPVQPDLKILPYMSSAEDLLAWFDKLRANKALYTTVIRNK